MRRFVFLLLTISLTVSLTFATSKPSLDGRAVVAEEGVLPAGLFAKTVGYLPGDSVSVTNPATGITINVLILGSIDPSAGVAILLSPEAADKLFITPDSNTQVKITKRTGMLDELASGSGTIISETPSESALPSKMQDELDTKLKSIDETLGMPESEQVPATEPVPETAEDVEAVALVPADAPVEEVPVEAEPEAVPPDEAAKYDVTAIEDIPMNHVLAEHDPAYIVETIDENFFEEPEMDPAEEALEDEYLAMKEDSAFDEILEDDSLIDPFAPIILVPADENPPADDPATEAESTFTPVPVGPAHEETAVAKLPAPSSALGTNQKNMVKTLDQLESGKYYVQVATFAEQENIDNLLSAYGSKYPFVMVPLKSGKAMQMMIGPLNVDEYGAILARFKNFGFKDSFLRKIR